MADETYLRSFVRVTAAGETEFQYVAPYEWARDIPGEELQHTIPSGGVEGADGEYQSDSFLAPRTLSVRGMITTTSGFADLRDKIDVLMLAHPKGAAGKLRRKVLSSDGATVLSDRYLECRVSYRSRGPEDGLYRATWEIGFRAANPHWQDWTAPAAVALNPPGISGGVTSLTPGGTEPAPSVITLVLTGSSGTVTVTEGEWGRSITLDLAAAGAGAGTYIIDCAARTVTKGGTSVLAAISAGGFFDIAPWATSLTLSKTGAAGVTSGTAQTRRRWAFAA